MTIRVAINGFGRIGRNIVRSWLERELDAEIEIVAINYLGNPEMNAHLLKYDSVHGTLRESVTLNGDVLTVDGHAIQFLSQRDPAELPWQELNIDVVFECTGLFTERDKANAHIQAGAKKVLISAPGKNVDATIVYGVNHESLSAEHTIVSNA